MADPTTGPGLPVFIIEALVVKVRYGPVTNMPFYVVTGVTIGREGNALGICPGPVTFSSHSCGRVGVFATLSYWVEANILKPRSASTAHVDSTLQRRSTQPVAGSSVAGDLSAWF